MKKPILLIAFLGITIASAQSEFKLDFESIMAQNIVANNDQTIVYRDLNPVTNGINSSQNAVKVIELAGSLYWSSTVVDKARQIVDFSNGRYFSVDFLSPKSKGMITLKFGKDIEKDFIYKGKPNTWRRAVFNFSNTSKSTKSQKIEIFFDVRDHNDPSATSAKNMVEEIFWFDNIRQSKRKIRKKR